MEAALPDDVLLEILARVADDVAALFRCAAACKRWRRLVVDPSFLRRRWPEHARDPSSLLGFFTHHRFRNHEDIIRGRSPGDRSIDFFPLPRSPLGPHPRLLSSFASSSDDLLRRAVPLAAHRGLLLVRLSPVGGGVVHLAVCNLLAGTCDVLPSLECSWFLIDHHYSNGYAILTGADVVSKEEAQQQRPPPLFKVLIIGEDQDKPQYSLRMFSSDQPSWSAPIKCFDLDERRVHEITICSDTAVCHGTAHWIVWSRSKVHHLDVNAETGHGSLHELPVSPDCSVAALCLSIAGDGILSLLHLDREDLRVEIWTRQQEEESGGSSWFRARVVELKQPGQLKRIVQPHFMCRGDKSGTLVVGDLYGGVYIADLQTGLMEQLTTVRLAGGFIRCPTVPFEVDWPALLARVSAW